MRSGRPPWRIRRNMSEFGSARRSASTVESATRVETDTIACGSLRITDGVNDDRYVSKARSVFGPPAKWWAKVNGRPMSPASLALKSLEPSSHSSGASPRPGVAVILDPMPLSSGGMVPNQASSSMTCWGKSSTLSGPAPRRRIDDVSPSLPGARPSPRSIRSP